ncbi:MAG: hypothetical protein ACFCBW_22810 [Candidatus Competibacterales bacterium]
MVQLPPCPSPTEHDLRWPLRQRYHVLEVIALWEGRLTTNHLTGAFGLSRQAASQAINTYSGLLNPRALGYDRHLKGYRPGSGFRTLYSAGHPEEYLALARAGHTLRQPPPVVEIWPSPGRPLGLWSLAADATVALATALRTGERLRVQQHRGTAGGPAGERVVVPHTLVALGWRWYVRGYWEDRADYGLVALGGLEPPFTLLGPPGPGGADGLWQRRAQVQVAPRADLPDAARRAVEVDYAMAGGRRLIDTNGVLALPLAQLLAGDPEVVATVVTPGDPT